MFSDTAKGLRGGQARTQKEEFMSYPLKYLFTAVFTDGTSYSQSPDDTPRIADHGSSFTDIASRLDDIVSFVLRSVEDPTHFVSVDLRDGSFTIGGLRFTAQDPSDPPPASAVFHLLYFRQVTRSLNGATGEESVRVVYHLGCETRIGGQDYRETIALS